MIRTVGNNGGASIDPAASQAGKQTFVDKIAQAETLGTLKIRAGNGEGLPTMPDKPGHAFSQFSEQLGMGSEILDGVGVSDTASTLNTLRSSARQQTTGGGQP
jgi:hypothetical protein